MMGRKCFNQPGYSGELVTGEGTRNNENPLMGTLVIEKLNRESDEIVSISGHQTSFLSRGKLELPLVRHFAHPTLMSAKCVDSAPSKYFCDLRAEVLIQVELHEVDLIKG